jgi:hypothetical protein
MPGFLLHVGATVMCAHGGQAMPTAPAPRVRVSSQPVATQSAPYSVAGCPFTTPAGSPMPCVTAAFSVAALRVKADGMPVLLQDSQAVTAPNGVPLMATVTQPRVKGM